MDDNGGDLLHTFLEDPQCKDDLCFILDENNLWKDVVNECNTVRSWYDSKAVANFEKSKSPSKALVDDLCNKAVGVRFFSQILLELKLERPLQFFCDHNPPEITTQPLSQIVLHSSRDSCLEIVVEAQGFPFPQYEWYKVDDDGQPHLIPEELEPTLQLSPVNKALEGKYYCRVFNENKKNELFEVKSTETHVMVLWAPFPSNLSSLDSPQIVCQPVSQEKLPIGSNLFLCVEAKGSEPLRYQWYKNGLPLRGQTTRDLLIRYLMPEGGQYLSKFQCRIKNDIGEVLSEVVSIKLDAESSENKCIAEDKVALLIGNSEYESLEILNSPSNDVHRVAQILSSLDFKVIALHNLKDKEMVSAINYFCDNLLGSGTYGVFYYVGHGFEEHHQGYMLPINAPHEYTLDDCICAMELKAKIHQRKPALSIMMLDMCRKKFDGNHSIREDVIIYEPEPIQNSIVVHATALTWSAYESKNEPHGFFIHHLSRFLGTNISLKEVFSKTSTSFTNDDQCSGLQQPTMEMAMVADCRLTDPINSDPKNKDASDKRLTAFKQLLQSFEPFILTDPIKLADPSLISVEVHFNPLIQWAHNIVRTINTVKFKTSPSIIEYYIDLTVEGKQVQTVWLRKKSSGETTTTSLFKLPKDKLELEIQIHIFLNGKTEKIISYPFTRDFKISPLFVEFSETKLPTENSFDGVTESDELNGETLLSKECSMSSIENLHSLADKFQLKEFTDITKLDVKSGLVLKMNNLNI